VQAAFRWNPEGPATDHDRACDVPHDSLGVLPIGPGQGLVLSTDAATAYYRDGRRRHLLLGWHYAPSEAALLDRVPDRESALAVLDEVEFRHPGGRLFLMCAADFPGSWVLDHDEFALPAGRYRVTLSGERGDDVAVLICRLRRGHARPRNAADPARRGIR
jgi:hypothetical protein